MRYHITLLITLFMSLLHSPATAQNELFSEGFAPFANATSPFTTNYALLPNALWSWSNASINATASTNGTGSAGCIALNTTGNSSLEFPVIPIGGVSAVKINARYFLSGSAIGVSANQVELQKWSNGAWVKVAVVGIGTNGTAEYTVTSYTVNVNDRSDNLKLRLFYNPSTLPMGNVRIHDVSVFQDNVIYTPDAPIEPWAMKGMLGRGFDVRWAEFSSDINCYSLKQVQDFAAKGFKNVRIRTNQKTPVVSEQPTEALRLLIRSRIDDALDCGMIPVLALNIDDFEGVYESSSNNPLLVAQAMRRDSIWWATLADWCKDYTHKLVFNINIEWTGSVKKDFATMNRYYEVVTPGIRKTNPTRILVYSPGYISDPNYLKDMVIPTSAGHYVMAEWHLYAAGPGDSGNKGWTTGTPDEKRPIIQKMDVAKAWETETNIPTWVGAWMAGNANHGNTFTAERQANFAAFMVSEFTRINVPWSINANHLYYDCSKNNWIDTMVVVLNVLSPLTSGQPNAIAPNPQMGNGVIIAGGALQRTTSELATITFFDCCGRVVYRNIWESERFALPLSLLAKGYFTILIEENGQQKQVLKYMNR